MWAIPEVTSPWFDAASVVCLEDFLDFVGNCAEEVGFVASEGVCEKYVLAKYFFRYE